MKPGLTPRVEASGVRLSCSVKSLLLHIAFAPQEGEGLISHLKKCMRLKEITNLTNPEWLRSSMVFIAFLTGG